MSEYVPIIEIKVTPINYTWFVKDKILSKQVKRNISKEEIHKTIKNMILKFKKSKEYDSSVNYSYAVRIHRRRIKAKTQQEKDFPRPYYAPNPFVTIRKEKLEEWGI